jgi:hypothetical protein
MTTSKRKKRWNLGRPMAVVVTSLRVNLTPIPQRTRNRVATRLQSYVSDESLGSQSFTP